MKLTFYSNFLNHHQLYICNEFYKRLGNDFKFVATEEVPKDRMDLGYEDMNEKYPFVLTTYDSEENEKKAMKLSNDSDIIILGSANEKYIRNRLKENKLSFRYAERIYKRGIWRVFSPRGIKNITKNHTKYRKNNVYMLCASAYTAGDFAMLGAYINKTYKWGYFPEVKEYNIEELMKEKQSNKIKILWCGRLLKWKHPELVLKIARKLIKENYDFEIDIIGIGEEYNKIKRYIEKNKLSKYVNLKGSMTPNEVRKNMEKANIFLFTSDYNEGWGAVLNEALNSACAVVASHAIGSVPFLIENNKNGLIYINGNERDLYNKVKKLIENRQMREEIGKNGYLKLKEMWNPEIAVQNFFDLVENLEKKEKIPQNGPGSIAKPINQLKMYKKINNTSI